MLKWGWEPSSGPYNYEAVWENPGDGFGTGYTTWTPITTVWQGTTETDFSFALFGINGIPASNPDPADGELAVELDKDISWSNPADAVSVEVFWGMDPNNLTSIYSGSPITSFEQGQMDYNTEYFWRVDVNDGDGVATGNTCDFFDNAQDSCNCSAIGLQILTTTVFHPVDGLLKILMKIYGLSIMA